MADAAATDRRTNSKRRRRRSGPPLDLRALTLGELDQVLTVYLGRAPRRDRLERDDRAYRWIIRRARAQGARRFRTTYTQAAKGIGYETTGDKARDFGLFRSRVGRALDSLKELGVIRYGGVTRTDGRWHCLEIELAELDPPPAARPIRRRRRHHNTPQRRPAPDPPPASRTPASRIFFGPEVGSPYGGCSASHSNPVGLSRAREREEDGAGFARPLKPNPRTQDTSASAGALASDHPDQLAALSRTFRELFRQPPRFSPERWHEPLARALRRLDRYADFGRGPRAGAGAELAAGLMAGHAEHVELYGDQLPRSLAYFVPILDEISKDWRRVQKPRLKAERRARSHGRKETHDGSNESANGSTSPSE